MTYGDQVGSADARASRECLARLRVAAPCPGDAFLAARPLPVRSGRRRQIACRTEEDVALVRKLRVEYHRQARVRELGVLPGVDCPFATHALEPDWGAGCGERATMSGTTWTEPALGGTPSILVVTASADVEAATTMSRPRQQSMGNRRFMATSTAVSPGSSRTKGNGSARDLRSGAPAPSGLSEVGVANPKRATAAPGAPV